MAEAVNQLNRWFARPADEAAVGAAPAATLSQIARRFWPDARPYRRWLPVLLLFVALGPALDAAAIWLYKILIDEVLVPSDFAAFPRVALAYIALTILGGVVAFADDVLSDWIGERFLLDVRTRVFAHVQRLPLDYVSGQRRGDLMARLTDDAADIETVLISGIAEALSHGLRIAFFAGALVYLNWRLALLAFVVAPVFWLASQVFARRIKAVSREQRRWNGAISAVAEESLRSAPLVQAYNRQDAEVARFRVDALGNFAAQMALTRLRAFFDPLLEAVQLGGVLVVVAAGTWELSQGNLTLGGLLVFLTYLTQLFDPVRGLVQLTSTMASASAGAERVIEVLDQPPAVAQRPDAPALSAPRGAVAFEDVSFQYPGARGAALDHVSFAVAPGETLALVGASGAGKSTIVRLLLRFHDPASGRVAIAGHDLRDVSLASLRDSMAVVLQEALVVSGTVRDNIAFGRPEASDDDIVRAAIAADAHDFIRALPQGYDTAIGQDGAKLSGGQRQRIAIARAMVRDAPILILDEPTTGLDAASSERIMRPLRRLMAGRTTIVVSHNLLTVQDATEIAVLDGGRIVERGTHESLLALDDAYARLYRLHHPAAAPETVNRELAGVA